jgi:hypothetical protein
VPKHVAVNSKITKVVLDYILLHYLVILFVCYTHRKITVQWNKNGNQLILEILGIFSSIFSFSFHTCLSIHLFIFLSDIQGQDSSVGITTRHGMDGPRIEFRLVARCSAPVQTGSGAHPASHSMGTASFPDVKRPGQDVTTHPNLTPRLKEEYSYTSTKPMSLRGLL